MDQSRGIDNGRFGQADTRFDQSRRIGDTGNQFADNNRFGMSNTQFDMNQRLVNTANRFEESRGRFDEPRSKFDDNGPNFDNKFSTTAPMRPDKTIAHATEKFDPKSLPTNFFYVSVSGVIESGYVSNDLYLQCKYEIVTGSDWELVIGQREGMSQKATTTSHLNKNLVWNFPFDATFRSLNPFGWPQLVVVVSGPDWFGRTVVAGYGSVHVPTTPGYHEREIYLYKPRPLSLFTGVLGWITGKIPEYETPSKVIAKGEGREVTRVDTVGKVKVKFNISEKNMKKFGYV